MANGSDGSPKNTPRLFLGRETSASHSPLRSLMTEVSGGGYTALETFAVAREQPGSIVIFEGDDGGTIYLTIPVPEVACGEPALRQLLLDIDTMCWSDHSMARTVYEIVAVGETVAGGMGGGQVVGGLWLHPQVEALGMREEIQQVLKGQLERIDTGGKRWR